MSAIVGVGAWVWRILVGILVAGCLVGLGWMLWAGEPGDLGVRAGVLCGITGVLVVVLWCVDRWREARAETDTGGADRAVEYLAVETLDYWRRQARARRITTPSPAAVRWAWAGLEVAAPPGEVAPGTLTEGVVTRVREELYQPDRGEVPPRLVFLGGPGAGKTTAMLLLLIDVLEHRVEGSGDPVPVWLTLGGWDPETTGLRDWVVATLIRDYPALLASTHGGRAGIEGLLRAGRVALFLDGLDEMADTLRVRAVGRLEEEGWGLRVVMTSRPGEYAETIARRRLWDTAVVEVLPVEADNARVFLLGQQVAARRQAWKPVIEELRHNPGGVVAQTLSSPLALSLARDAYTHDDPATLIDVDSFPTPEALLRHLLTQTLAIAYPDPTEREHATRWLSQIAHWMGDSRDLRWWDVPIWAPNRRLSGGLIPAFGLALGLVVGLLVGLLRGLGKVPAAGLVVGIPSMVLGMFAIGMGQREPHTFETRMPKGSDIITLGKALMVVPKVGLVFGLVIGLVTGFLDGLASGLASGLVKGLMGGLVLGVVFGFAFGLVSGLLRFWSQPLETTKVVSPSRSYEADRRRTVVFWIVGGLVGGLVIGLLNGPKFGPVYGLPYGVMVGILYGRGPATRLGLVEIALRLRGQRVRFMPLLQTASERQILRQVGAVYQFRHAEMQRMLAQARTSSNEGDEMATSTPSTPTLILSWASGLACASRGQVSALVTGIAERRRQRRPDETTSEATQQSTNS